MIRAWNEDSSPILDKGMGTQTPTSFDRTKTYWTPAMECFFVDLMLDQMQKGNKIGHTFSKQAWTDMLTMLNARFKSQYDKDALGNHYTTLWKQFNDIKNLLDQNGFAWDDTCQMVVADDYLWDCYIKAHPDAQMYRNKAVTNFSDLCLIYTYTTADGRYSRASHDVDYDNNSQEVNMAVGKEEQTPTGDNCSRAYWTRPMDIYLIDLLLDQVQKGHRIGHALMTQAWNEIVKLFNARFKSHFKKEMFKKRFKDLRQQYSDVKVLLDKRGFSWDEELEMVIVDDSIWDSYTKEFPDSQLYKCKTVPSYHKLRLVYGEEGSTRSSSPMLQSIDLHSWHPVFINDNACSQVEWTPSMERCLIDLMLEHVHKGNWIDHISDKQAWIQLAASFNERFGSHHDLYELTCRKNNLRKLYKMMKYLLDRSEFSWDETGQMVTASNDAWDAYVKDCPDLESFRTKLKPNYNDLSVLYGKSTSNGRVGHSLRDLNFNSDGWDSQALQNSSCQTINWTPPMDRCFIDLMLEQIRRRSMADQKFRKDAWSYMGTRFGANFGFKHRKEDLQSRFKTLRMIFNDMNILLDHSGFAWNEMQQRIIASDDIWDAYIMDHHDAASYRNQTLPNYSDLFLIYGKTTANGGHDYSNYSVDVHGDNAGVLIGQGDDKSSCGSDILGIVWTKAMDRFFIDLMLEQVFKGNKADETFSMQGWLYITISFNENFGLNFHQYVMEKRYLSLLKQYKDISNHLNQNGFAWDKFQQMTTVDNGAWEAYAKEFPDAVKYGHNVLENYSDLSIVFNNGVSSGRSSSLDPDMIVDDNTLETGMEGIFGDLRSSGKYIGPTDHRKKRQSTKFLNSTLSRKVKKANKERFHGTIESIVDALQAVPGMDDELFLDACNLLEDGKKAKGFVKMDTTKRKEWLLRKLHT